ncbi:Beta glucosidase 40 [Carex littledalei]|uniref:Beta glucosidase 40 n=1 Tax=Carex littledalei TaxID=544730 RepID=A0A833VUL2_9POAL|nr:Beta glucosidase 40 [Carex littledalei]
MWKNSSLNFKRLEEAKCFTIQARDSTTDPYIVAHNTLQAHATTSDIYMRKYKINRIDGWEWRLSLSLARVPTVLFTLGILFVTGYAKPNCLIEPCPVQSVSPHLELPASGSNVHTVNVPIEYTLGEGMS